VTAERFQPLAQRATSATDSDASGSGGPAGEGWRAGADLVAWAWLGVIALGVAGGMAILLALSRVPGLESLLPWPVGFFRKGLILHVVLSIVVWFTAVFAALSAVREADAVPPPGWQPLGSLAAAVLALSLPCLILPAFRDRGEPFLNNYVPVIDDPLFFAGLLLLAVATLVVAGRVLIKALASPSPVASEQRLVNAAAVILLVALVCFALAGWQVAGTPPGYWFYENLMWGGGHVLQFANTALMLVGWSVLVQALSGRPAPGRRLTTMIALLLIVAVVPTPAFYAFFPAFSGPQADAFSQLKYLAGAPAVLVLVACLVTLPRPWAWRSPLFHLFGLSVLLFCVGGVFGIFVDGADTRTPAHYHGMIAGVSLAAMGLFFVRFLPALRCPSPSSRAVSWTAHLFGWGQLLACIGLFTAGGYGAPRKVAGDAQGLVDLGAILGLGLNGLGGLVAVAGGIVFVITAGRALLAAPAPEARSGTSLPRRRPLKEIGSLKENKSQLHLLKDWKPR
jgi:hypothetical protein